ncbi:MAG: hypothetical protein JKY08_03570 [Flavobacteriaceae bacterium]|nr:hypothetical protein [Flavobacteriaceae bacterium]
MAVNILFVEPKYVSDSQIFELLEASGAVVFTVVNSLEGVPEALEKASYSHIVCNSIADKNTFRNIKYLFRDIPVLIVCEDLEVLDLTGVHFTVIKKPLTYQSVFNFIAQKPIISNRTLEKFAMGDLCFITEMKQLIIEEFEASLTVVPSYLKAENFKAVKSNMHQLIGKFALLEMDEAHGLSKRIDSNILKNSGTEIPHVHQVLFEVEIALTQLKYSA